MSELHASPEELARIEQDVAQQEMLIAGYQKENERLTEALKKAREAQRAEVLKGEEEVRRLSLRISELERSGGAERGTEGLRDQVERAHRLASEARDAAAEREAEMRYEMDRLRAAKRELEAKVGRSHAAP